MSDKHFKPGSFGCHEILHMTSFLCDAIDKELLEHGSIKDNVDWENLARKAHNNLAELYQAIGAKHLK